MELKAILFIILIATGELLLVFGVFGCGGAAFTLIPPDPNEAEASQPPEAADPPEASPPDAFKLPRPDAGHPSDASYDTQPEAMILEASPFEASPPEACVPSTSSTFACGTDRVTTTAPSQFCVVLNNVTTAPGQPTPTPPECRCDYSCACILAAIPNPCGSQIVARCLDKQAPLMRPGSVVVCQ